MKLHVIVYGMRKVDAPILLIGLGNDAANVWTIAISQLDPKILYAGFNTLGDEGTGVIFKTSNGGENWSRLTNAPSDVVLSLSIRIGGFVTS